MVSLQPLLYGIVGFPLGQTLSPALHRWGFSETGWPGVYCIWEQSTEQLEGFVQAVRSLHISGVSVTVPHKESIIQYLDEISDAARAIGAVNTLLWKGTKLVGDNTDVAGFCHSLIPGSFDKAFMLGAGGSARAVLYALSKLKVPTIYVSSQTSKKTEDLAALFGATPFAWDEKENFILQSIDSEDRVMVINTTPLGMYGKAEGETPISREFWPKLPTSSNVLAYDLVYNPAQRPFLQGAGAVGCKCQDGLLMLAAQGVEQLRLWTGHSLSVEEALTALELASCNNFSGRSMAPEVL